MDFSMEMNNKFVEPLCTTSLLVDKPNSATITIRMIRSFKFNNWKPILIANVPLDVTTEDLMELIHTKLPCYGSIPATYHRFAFDSLKIEYQPHGFKTNDPLMNTENDEELMLKPGLTLGAQGIQNETEITYFKMSDYQDYVAYKQLQRTGDW